MKRQIRESIWESNSSSCHTLTYKHRHLKPSDLPMDKDGKVHCEYGSFGDDNKYDTQYEKLQYIMTHTAYSRYNYWRHGDVSVDTYEYECVEDALKKYIPGCTGLVMDNSPDDADLNHQLQDELRSIVDVYSEDDVINFVFDDNVVLEIWHD